MDVTMRVMRGAMIRPGGSRRDGYGDCRDTQGQRNMKRPAKRNHTKHTQSSVDTPVPLRRAPLRDSDVRFALRCGDKEI